MFRFGNRPEALIRGAGSRNERSESTFMRRNVANAERSSCQYVNSVALQFHKESDSTCIAYLDVSTENDITTNCRTRGA